ncbi:Rok-like winged helix domain-containing protein [Bacillus sp. FJAT-42315]|uniref:Rok-like winged helix domain-containing protein n=1 Tax=Bacillus sp. FJAT-42315 TaxID=2014077 RepID=UPI000BA97F28|nr:competence protein ComK [Bacillus sp. FJAT-42315]PAQ13997.1 competence protein ComK [Bacillaceae bacterium SAOS 7]
MFDERVALKIRLEQLADSEFKIIREFNREREVIFQRLKELDAAGNGEMPKEMMAVMPITSLPDKKKRGRRSENLDELRNTAISVLKAQNTPIRGVELQRQIEENTGKKIANMTTFMVALERENQRVRKLGRGLYIYDYEG